MKKPLLVGFLGSPRFSADLLRHLVHECSDLVQIVAVWTNPPKPAGRGAKQTVTPVALCAKALNLPLIEKSKMSQEDAYFVAQKKIDLLLVVAYGSLLPRFFFDAPRYGSYNLHFSLLPAYRGASPIQSAILAGERESGITLQTIAPKMDRGDIVARERLAIKNLNTTEILAISLEKSKKMLRNFFVEMDDFAQFSSSFVAQDEKNATYCRKIQKADGKITANTTLELLRKKFLAYRPWPGVFCFVAGEKIEISLYNAFDFGEAEESGFFDGLLPRGCFFLDQNKRLLLVLADGVVEIVRLKRQGKKEMTAGEFVNGYRSHLPCFIDDI